MNIFTESNLMTCGATQQAMLAMLRLDARAYKPAGACVTYYIFVRKALNAADAKALADIIHDASSSYPRLFEEFLWLLETVDYSCLEKAEYETIERAEEEAWADEKDYLQRLSETRVLWAFLLGDFVDSDGFAVIPDMEQDGASDTDIFFGIPVLLFDRSEYEESWTEFGALRHQSPAGMVCAKAHRGLMAIPVVGHVPLWDKWCYAPLLVGSPIVRYKELLDGSTRFDEWADEPKIRAAVARRAKSLIV